MARQTVIHTPTSDLESSKDFYRRLEFKLLSQDDPTVFTDGKALIEINPDRHARAGVKIYLDDPSKTVSSLREFSEVLEIENGFLASDPNGVRVYYTDQQFGLEFEPKEESFGLTGNYAGLSIEAHDIEQTVRFWEAAGFEQKGGDLSQGWATFSDGSTVDLSLMKPLMCPHLFFNPGITYFNGGKNLTNIGKIREAGIPITEEITHFSTDGVADNIIIRDPGGYGFFVFND